jgi:energy-coupling factor transporter ATP-binding protein EcfA2
VERLRDLGLTVIMATHSNDQACRMGDRIIRLEHGRIAPEVGRIAPGRLSRGAEGLILQVPESVAGPGPASITAIELAADTVLIRLDSRPAPIRVSLREVEQARPLPGETVTIRDRNE